jgi:hypothetical protein
MRSGRRTEGVSLRESKKHRSGRRTEGVSLRKNDEEPERGQRSGSSFLWVWALGPALIDALDRERSRVAET